MTTRRTMLAILAATATAGAAGLAWHAWRQGVFASGEGPPYQPWHDWQPTPGRGESAVRAAILAASPHNTQPWRFRVSPSRIDLFADTARNIGAIDPLQREMHIGLGCALENLLLATRAAGFATGVLLLPAGTDSSHIAAVQLTAAERDVSPLYAAIPRRHTNRGPYDTSRNVGDPALRALEQLAAGLPDVGVIWFTSPRQREQVAALTVAATRAIIADTAQSHDSAAWFRMTREQVLAHRDGVTLDAAGLSPAVLALAKLFPPASREASDAAWLAATRDVHVRTAAAFGILVARDARDNAHRIQGGRLWQRMHLWATGEGLAMQPLNQMAERADREATERLEPVFGQALAGLIADTAWHALMPFRLGYPQRAALPSPRRALQDVLIAAA